MNKNFFLIILVPLVGSVSLLGMDRSEPIPITNGNRNSSLEESIMTIPLPKTRGLGFWRSTKDLIWNEEENIYAELESRTLDLDNSSNHRKLDATIEIYSAKKNSERLAAVLALCRQEPFKGFIQINDISACMAHDFLTKENKHQQLEFKNIIEEKDKLFISKQNILLDALQLSLDKQITEINTQLNLHIEERNVIVAEQSKKIQKLKLALIQLHHLNKKFILPNEGYCSDEEDKEDIIKKNEQNVELFYSDQHLLKKIQVDFSMNETKTKNERMIKTLGDLNQAIRDIQQLRY